MAKCLRCGQCCISAFFADAAVPIGEDPKEKARWWQYHHCEVVPYPKGDKFAMGVRVPLTCMHLIYRDGQYSCKIYDKRPVLCRDYFCPRAQSEE